MPREYTPISAEKLAEKLKDLVGDPEYYCGGSEFKEKLKLKKYAKQLDLKNTLIKLMKEGD